MFDDLSPLKETDIYESIIEYDQLVTQSDKVFLIGAGCSKCAGLPLMDDLTKKVFKSKALRLKTKNILNSIKTIYGRHANVNIEDYLSELVDFVSITDRRTKRGAKKTSTSINGYDYSVEDLNMAIDEIKQAVVEEIDIEVSYNIHLQFIQSVHRPSRPGRMINNRPVDYLVLNYDTLIESALALERLPYADGMSGGETAWWDSTTYQMEGLAARVLKLHGSIDWNEIYKFNGFSADSLPRRVARNLKFEADRRSRVLIWPASTKYREIQRDPYAQLSDLARKILHPHPGKQTVLTVCGYSFNDTHINDDIGRALRESRGELTLVVFTSDETPIGVVKQLHEDINITDQVRIYARRGFFHGDKTVTSSIDLPWYKFETITRILGGELL